MVGQIKLQEKVNNLTLDSLPQSLILVGEYGCGKHLIVESICNKFDILSDDIVDILLDKKSDDRKDYLDELEIKVQTCTEHRIFVLDSSHTNIDFERLQNKILKILEEQVNPFAHIIILTQSLNGLLPTITNRCKIWRFESYKKEELKQFSKLPEADFELLYNILNTPGKLLEVNDNIKSYISDIEKIFTYIDKALISNVLTLPNKLYYSKSKKSTEEVEDTKLLNFDIFVDLLLNIALRFYSENKIGFDAYLLTNELVKNNRISSVDKMKLYERYLIELKDDIKRFKNEN